MKLCVSKDWMRQNIEGDQDYNVEAGRVIRNSSDVIMAIKAINKDTEAAIDYRGPRPLQIAPAEQALSLLVKMTRRKDRLTIQQFADKIRVAPTEVEEIENNPKYAPRPRTIHNLAEYVRVPPRTILSLMPTAPKQDKELNDAAYRFAASSGDLTELSKQERNSLRDFVNFLSKHKGIESKDV